MQIKQTKKLESVLLGGCYEARRRSSSEVTTDHLFLAILKQEESHASHVLRKLLKNWEIDQIKTRLEREMGPVVAQDGRSQALRQTIAINGESMLRQIISDAGKGCVVEHMLNTGHLLRAILDDRSSISSRILALYNVTGETAAPFLKDLPPNEDYYENMRFLSLLGDDEGEHPERLFSGVMRIGAPAGDKPKDSMLDQFGVDLTRCAAEGKLDPVIGREAEIERVIQILGRRKKNNPVLIGEAGVGLATLISRICMPLMMLAYFLRDVSFRRYLLFFTWAAQGWRRIRQLLSVGLPISVQMVLEVSAFALSSIMMGWIGAVELAAHQIVVTFGNFAFMAMVGISSATTILVSHRFGRGDLDGLTRAATASCHLALMTNFLTMCCFIGLRHWIPLLFTSDTAVAAVAAQLFIMAGLYQFSDGLQVVLLGVLRGMQDVKIVMRYAFVSYIVINLPVGYLCAFTLGMGAPGLWVGFIFGLGVAALLYWRRYRRLIRRIRAEVG